jgi:tRNA dimethylallyltransferase
VSDALSAPVLFLLGPTAAGKTALACALAERFPVDLISVDSALVYRHMNIGTAKPSAEMLQTYPHALIDLVDPTEAYSAANFRRDALQEIERIRARGRVPLLVGGTMMYVKALLEGLSALPAADPEVRAHLEARAARDGWPALHAMLREIDPLTAARLSPNDSQRIQRALEVFELTGQPLSTLQTRDAHASATSVPFNWHGIALLPSDRSVLHERIAVRFDEMLEMGLIDEVRDLRARFALNADMPSMRCVGYRQVWQHLDGEISSAQLRYQGIVASRQLAKRQLTWLRSMPLLEALDCLDTNIEKRATALLARWLDAPPRL